MIAQLRDSSLLLPIIFDDLMATRVQLEHLRVKVVVSDEIETFLGGVMVIAADRLLLVIDRHSFAPVQSLRRLHALVVLSHIWAESNGAEVHEGLGLVDVLVI